MLSERRQNIEEIREGGNEAAGAVDGRNDAEVAVEIRNFAGDDRPVLLGITERLEYVDALTHVEDLVRYRARGHAMEGNRIRILAERLQSVVEVYPPSANAVNMPASRSNTTRRVPSPCRRVKRRYPRVTLHEVVRYHRSTAS